MKHTRLVHPRFQKVAFEATKAERSARTEGGKGRKNKERWKRNARGFRKGIESRYEWRERQGKIWVSRWAENRRLRLGCRPTDIKGPTTSVVPESLNAS